MTGETNTDDLSPAPDAFTRPDIPVHALAMLKIEREGIIPDVPGTVRYRFALIHVFKTSGMLPTCICAASGMHKYMHRDLKCGTAYMHRM